MKKLAVALVAVCAMMLPSAVRAEQVTPKTAPVTFSLSVAGAPDGGTTFWVSYGPLAGKFAIKQLHATSAHTYGVTLQLPVQARGTFYYLTGQGTMKTKVGPVPGNPVATIKQVGPATVNRGVVLTASWHPPVG